MFSPSQRNSVYKALELQKQNPRDFQIEPTNEWLKVTHKATGFFFRFQPTEVRTNRGNELWFFVHFTPSKQGVIFSATKEQSVANLETLEKALPHFSNWLVFLKQEFEEPDLWAELERTPDSFVEGEELPEDAFTPAEIKLLESRIADVEQRITDLNLPPDAEAAIIKAVQDVPEKAKRLTKKEVGEILFSTMMREGLKALLTKENMLAVWHTLYHLFQLALN